MPTAEELIVQIRSEGVGETTSQLENVEQSMEETAQSAGDSAEQLQGFAERFKGALGAAITALSVGAAGLLSTVPVLGEAFSGLAAIVRALAFQVDSLLRPVLSPLSTAFYEVANAIYEADGIIGGIIGAITTLVSLAAIIIPAIAAIGSQLGVWASVGAGVIAILTKIGAVIASVAGAIASLPAAVVVAIAAILAFAVAYLTNFRGVRDTTNKIVGQIIDFVVNGFNTLATKAIKLVRGFAKGVATWFSDLADNLSSWASGVASDAYNWGVSIIQSMIDGMVSLAESIAKAVQRVINGMIDVINTALDQLPEEVTSRVGVEQISRVSFDSDFGTGGGGGGSSGRPRFRRGTSAGGATYLDGRNLTESTGRYRSDPGRRRGL